MTNHKPQTSNHKPQTIGIFGGSFNPIHVGHIGLAKQILQEAGLDEIWFMVSPLNPFKKRSTDLLDDDLRLLMTKKALENEPRMKASDYEFHLPKPSYTWNTLQHLSNDFPDYRFSLIIGADNWLAFDKWSHPDYILNNFDLYVYVRKDNAIDSSSLPDSVHLVNAGFFPVSSTEIRKRVKDGLPINGMVPDNIVDLAETYYKKEP